MALFQGEGNGPEAPDRKDVGILVMGANPVAVDAVCAKMMGFDWEKIPTIRTRLDEQFRICDFGYDNIQVKIDTHRVSKKSFLKLGERIHSGFAPPIGWRGKVEDGL